MAILNEDGGMSDWWCQMVAVAYERARGLRENHEKPGGWPSG